MTTVRDLLESALRKISALGAGESMTAEEAQDGLKLLNQMISSWNTDGATVYTESLDTYNMVAGNDTVTMGSGGDINTTRPVRFLAFNVVYGTVSNPVAERDVVFYSGIIDKQLSGIPEIVWPDYGYPLQTLKFWPVPLSGVTLNIYSEKPLSEYTSVNDAVTLAPGYEMALIYNLAVAWAPEFEKEASPTVQSVANKALANIKRANRVNQNITSDIDNALTTQRVFNIYSGY